MTAPVKPAPTVGDYGGAAQTSGASTSSSSNPNDIWGLGDLYGQPIYLGLKTVSGYAPLEYRDGAFKPGAPTTRKVTDTEDNFGPAQDLMQKVVDMWSAQRQEHKKNPNALTGYEQLQQALYRAGFYGQTAYDSIHVGQWTSQTQDAMKAAIGSYETTRTGGHVPITFTEFLLNNAQGGADGGFSGGAGGSTKAPFQASLTDPASIRQSAQSAAMQALGQGLSSDQLDAFVAQFQAAQTSAEKAGYDGKDYTSPDLSSQAAAYAQTTAPGAYKQNQRQVFLDSMANLLAGNNVRPSMSPTPTA